MTNYTKTMREALQSMYISEDNIAILRDIVKRKSAMPLKFADGKMKVDLFTASAVTQALDKVNPANKAKITKMINTGKKANFMSVAKVVMKSENDPEIEEEEVKVEEVSLLAQQAAILISKRELERNPRKEEVEIKEGKFKKGDTVIVLSGPHKNDVHKIIHDHGDGTYNVKPWRTRYGGHISKIHYRLGAATAKASDLKKEEVELDELMPPSRHVGKSKKNPDMFCVFDTNGKEVKLFKDEDDAKEYAVKNHDALMGHDKPKKEEDELDEGKMNQLHQYIKDKKSAEEIAKLMKVDVKTIKTLMSSNEPFKEEAELDEGQLKDMLAQAGDIEYYAKRSGGIDKKDMMKAASLLKKGNKSGALNFVSKLDTSPREKILDLMGEEVEVQEKRAIRNYKYDKAFFINDGKDKLKNLLDREGYDEISLGDYLSQKAGLKNRDNLYFDGGSLVYGSKTIAKGAYGKTVSKLLDVVKNIKEEVEESYEFGTDEYTKHTKDVTPGQGKEIDEARPSARRDAMKAMGKRGKDSADDDDYVATADDRKAADKNIIMQLRKATNLGGKYEVTFKDKKKVKVKPEIAMAFIKKFEKMKPVDKAKLQDKGSKSYKDLLKGLKEEDTSILGRIEKKLKEIKNG